MPCAIVVGSINRDIVAYVDRHPQPGETVIGKRSATFPGGKGANQAVAVARLGGSARMIGRVGCDGFGTDMRGFLAGEAVDVTGVASVAGVATGIGLICVDAASENMITVIPGANHAWDGGLGAFAVSPADMVICQLEVPLAIVAAAFTAAKLVGAATLLNPAPWQAVPDAILAATDMLVVNEIEIAQLAGAGPDLIEEKRLIEVARAVLARGPRAVVITLGAAGALVVEAGGRSQRIAGRPVRAVDTTGAGDCFAGALASELLRGEDLAIAAHFANRAAALSVAREGAAASFPRRGEIG